MGQMVLPLGEITDAAWVPTRGSAAIWEALAGDAVVMCMFGPHGCGKSHILKIAAGQGWTTFDDVETWADVDGLFHATNAALQGHGRVLVSSQMPVAQVALLPDVKSRLLLGAQVELGLPDDTELRAMWQAWAAARQLEIADAVADFVLARASRNPGALRACFEQLDALGLAEKRALTVPLARALFLG